MTLRSPAVREAKPEQARVDPEFKRQQFAELKAAIGRIIERKPRKNFTPAQRRGVYEAAEGICAGCSEHVGKRYEVDHILSAGLNGDAVLSNAALLCIHCHKVKTRLDKGAQAKAKRLAEIEENGREPCRDWPAGKLSSRGFDKRLRKRMDGTVVPREARR